MQPTGLPCAGYSFEGLAFTPHCPGRVSGAKTTMLFDIINPHDPYTLEADDLEIAANAIALIGRGQYGLQQLSGDKSATMPMFPVTGHDEWFTKQFGRDFATSLNYVMENRAADLAKALASVSIGTPAQKREFEQEAADCKDEEEFQALLAKRHDAIRTSMVDIGRIAWGIADIVGARVLEEQPAVKAD